MPNSVSLVKQVGNKSSFSILILLEMITALVYLFGGNRFLIIIETLIVLLLTLLVLAKPRVGTTKVFYWVLIASIIIWIIFSLVVKHRHAFFYVPFAPSNLVSIYSSFLIAFVLVYFPLNVKMLKMFYYCVVVFFVFTRVILKIPFETITGVSSAAYLGLTLMAFIIPIIYLEYRDKHTISFLPLLLQSFLFLFVSSRTTLGYSLLLLFASIYIVIKSKTKNIIVRVLEYTVLIGVVLLVLYLIVSSNSSLAIVEKFQDEGTGTNGRELIWANYFYNFSLDDLFWGREVEVPFYDGDAFQNAHNSWIQLHSQTGFLCVLYVCIVLWLMVYFLIKTPFYTIVILSLILLSFFNYVFFFKNTDWALYIFFFEFMRSKETPKQQQSRIKLSLI